MSSGPGRTTVYSTGSLGLAAFGMVVYLMTQHKGSTVPSLAAQESRIAALESQIAQMTFAPTATQASVVTGVVKVVIDTLESDSADATTTSAPDSVTISLASATNPTTLLTMKRSVPTEVPQVVEPGDVSPVNRG